MAREKRKVSLEDEYSRLDSKERDFCKERNIACKDFYNVKMKILSEQAKNTAITHQILKERGRNVAECK